MEEWTSYKDAYFRLEGGLWWRRGIEDIDFLLGLFVQHYAFEF